MAIEMSKYEDIIEMEIWSSFGCFTKPFSNTGGLLTYLIPPKTSVIGMIGAVLGYDFEDFTELEDGTRRYKIEELYDIHVSIQSLFDLKVKRVTFNSHYGNEPNLMNIHEDVLIEPFYKLYINFPEKLNKEQNEFLKRLKSNETVYTLYMGRNEFFMNYEFVNHYKNVETEILDSENSSEFFKQSEEQKIYGILDKRIVENVTLSETTEQIIFGRLTSGIKKLASFYEYIIRDYPIKRYNFINFEYAPVSFYSMNKKANCFFSNLDLKEDMELNLYKIGENEWISLI